MSDKTFEVYNPNSGHTLGFYRATDAGDALDVMARDAGYSDYVDMCETVPDGDLRAVEVVACADCQTRGETRTCCRCGATATVIDCGHQPQPAVISAGRDDGSDMDHWYCGDCGRGATL